MSTNLEERKKALEQLSQQKVTQLQGLESARNQLTTEIIELRGKINLLDELLKEIPK